jgi:hypothetical protein
VPASRAKKKRRREARAAAGTAGGGSSSLRVDASPQRSGRAPRERGMRFEMRDGVARPKPPWAPYPISEALLVIGIAVFLLGFFGGKNNSPALIGFGAAVLTIVVAELCIREHFKGFRSHSILLAILAVAVLHTFLYFVVSKGWRGPPAFFTDLVGIGVLSLVFYAKYRSAHVRAREAR